MPYGPNGREQKNTYKNTHTPKKINKMGEQKKGDFLELPIENALMPKLVAIMFLGETRKQENERKRVCIPHNRVLHLYL